jgi:carbon storage regulator CsrA
VLIGDQIEVEILETSPSQVKLGIRAPRTVSVLRKEIQVTLEQNREVARELSRSAIARLCASLQGPILKKSRREPIKPV